MNNATLEYNSRNFVRLLVQANKSEEEIIDELRDYDDFMDMPKVLRGRTVEYAEALVERRRRGQI